MITINISEQSLEYKGKSYSISTAINGTGEIEGSYCTPTGNFKIAEKFYLQGLSINPKHNGINEYLGELYVQTNRMDKANERLEVLKSCNCKEFGELELIIKTRGTKVY